MRPGERPGRRHATDTTTYNYHRQETAPDLRRKGAWREKDGIDRDGIELHYLEAGPSTGQHLVEDRPTDRPRLDR